MSYGARQASNGTFDGFRGRCARPPVLELGDIAYLIVRERGPDETGVLRVSCRMRDPVPYVGDELFRCRRPPVISEYRSLEPENDNEEMRTERAPHRGLLFLYSVRYRAFGEACQSFLTDGRSATLNAMKLTFHGGARSVTGSNYLFETRRTKVLVDCGLHQGSHFCEKHNFEPFQYDPRKIEAVFITHAHIDHIGRLPQLVRAGFHGWIYSTAPTKDEAEFLLLDSEHLLREDAEKHKREPLYDTTDVAKTMALWKDARYHETVQVGDISVTLYDAGHILGSSSILLEGDGKRVVLSGDLGNSPEPLLNPPEYFESADYALIESTYGNRVHERLGERRSLLEDALEDTVKAKGTLMIPAFALERTQELLFELNDLVQNSRVPKLPIFVDSPLAIKLTTVYEKYSHDPTYFSKISQDLVRSGEEIFNFPGLTLTLTTEESKHINEVRPPKVIMAGAGMSNGGRILHHELRYLSDPKSAILFIGYQGAGSLGRKILEGAESVTIFGETVPVRCRKYVINGYSAHADQPQLLKWIQPLRLGLTKVFVVQGEEEESQGLAQKIRDEFAVAADIPRPGETVVL